MQYIIDSAHVEAIKHCIEYFPVDGVTTNPTIISKENRDFLGLVTELRDLIGPDRMLHIQTTADAAAGIVAEAELLKKIVGYNFFIKIPITEDGLKATMELKKRGINVTMTAIFTQQQALLAAKAGADYVAPYVNRLDNVLADGVHVVGEIVNLFNTYHLNTKVLAASFKNAEQVHRVSLLGGHAVTIAPDLFPKLIYHPMTMYAIDDFNKDWESVYGDKKISDMIG